MLGSGTFTKESDDDGGKFGSAERTNEEVHRITRTIKLMTKSACLVLCALEIRRELSEGFACGDAVGESCWRWSRPSKSEGFSIGEVFVDRPNLASVVGPEVDMRGESGVACVEVRAGELVKEAAAIAAAAIAVSEGDIGGDATGDVGEEAPGDVEGR